MHSHSPIPPPVHSATVGKYSQPCGPNRHGLQSHVPAEKRLSPSMLLHSEETVQFRIPPQTSGLPTSPCTAVTSKPSRKVKCQKLASTSQATAGWLCPCCSLPRPCNRGRLVAADRGTAWGHRRSLQSQANCQRRSIRGTLGSIRGQLGVIRGRFWGQLGYGSIRGKSDPIPGQLGVHKGSVNCL